MVAMLHDGTNAYPNGKWGRMEKAWADALKQGKKVKVDIEPIYNVGNTTARPNSFKVTEWINGVENKIRINNF